MAEFALTEGDNGARLTVHVGDVVNIHLQENSAAGYRWTASSLDDMVFAVERQTYVPTSAAIGNAGTVIWRLRARLGGRRRVELEKSRPWESIAYARFVVDLDVQDI